MAHIFYSETQRLSRAWLLVLSLDSAICFTVVWTVSGGKMETLSLAITICLAVLFAAIAWILVTSKLETRVDDAGIHFRYPVFWPGWRTFNKGEIRHAELQRYDAMSSVKDRKCRYFVLWGTDAVLHVELLNGKHYRIGTENKEGMSHVINQLMNHPS